MSNLLKSKFLLGALIVAFMLVGFAVVKTNTVAAASCSITSTLRTGSTGVQVVCLQTGLGGLTADGNFGPLTKTAVMAWQSGHGLVADGIFGPKSRAAWGSSGGVSGNFPIGCTSAAGYSPTTGMLCSATTNLPAGCSSTTGYSPTTGASCSGLPNLPAGCSSTGGFSSTTGFSCATGLPAVIVRGGGSGGGGGHRALGADATLSATSKFKGVTLDSLGTPSDAIIGLVNGGVLLTKEQAEDESNAGDFVSSFNQTDPNATIKIVKYEFPLTPDNNPGNFETDEVYNGTDPMPNGGFIFVKVTAENGDSLYYFIVVEVQAEGTADAATGTSTITYTLTAGTFDDTGGIDVANWTLGGADVADLGDITDIALSVDNTVATLTIDGTVDDDTKIYTVEPSMDVFTVDGIFTPPLTPTAVTVRAANTSAALDFTPATGTSLTNVVLTDDTDGETGTDEDNAMPLSVTIVIANAAEAIFEPVSNHATITAYADDGSGSGSYVAVAANYDFSGANTTLWIKSISEDTSDTLYYKLTVTLASNDAEITTESTVKDKTVTDLGTPATTIAGIADAGAVTISTVKAADAVGDYVTEFITSDAGATTKVVKYASGASTTNFATATAYADGAIANNDFFIVRVIAEDPSVVQYYKIVVSVVADLTEIAPMTATFENSDVSPLVFTTITTLIDANGDNALAAFTDDDGTLFNFMLTDGVSSPTVTKTALSADLTVTNPSDATDTGIYILTITRVADAQEWTIDVTVTTPAAYALGDVGPAGGFIFYVKDDNTDGWRYLEAAAANFYPAPTTRKWSDPDASVIGTDDAVGTGQANTTAILGAIGGETLRAAQVCDALDLGASDWFLPSIDELAEMYVNIAVDGGFGVNQFWSSTENPANADDEALVEDFSDGSTPGVTKSGTAYVRCARVVSETDQTRVTPSTETFNNIGPGGATVTVTQLRTIDGDDLTGDFANDDLTLFSISLTDGTNNVAVTKADASQDIVITDVTDAVDTGIYVLTITRLSDSQTWGIAVTVTDNPI